MKINHFTRAFAKPLLAVCGIFKSSFVRLIEKEKPNTEVEIKLESHKCSFKIPVNKGIVYDLITDAQIDERPFFVSKKNEVGFLIHRRKPL